jgi:DNA-binding NtrC family response regulator
VPRVYLCGFLCLPGFLRFPVDGRIATDAGTRLSHGVFVSASPVKPRVLLVEDTPEYAQAMLRAFSKRFDCRQVSTIDEAMAALPRGPWGAVVANYGLDEGGSGVEVLQVVRETLPRTFRLIYSEIRSPSFRRDAQRIVQPHFTTDITEPDFIGVLERALEALFEPPSLEIPPDLPAILTDVWTVRAPTSREFLRMLRGAAERDGPVYIYGEPGSGVTRSGITLRQWRREWKARGSPAGACPGSPVPIRRVPALRERPQDLPLLAARCLIEISEQSGEPLRRLSPRASEELLGRDWYGNIIELATVILRALQRARTRLVIEVEDLPQDKQPAWRPSQYAKDEGQRDCLLRQLRTARNVSAASRLEGCSRANYIRLMRRLGIIRADIVTDPALEGTEASAEVD